MMAERLSIQKGQKIFVADCRKGSYRAIAEEDFVFDPESEESYPVILDQDELGGMNTIWLKGDRVPCINGLAIIRLRGE